MYYGFGDPEQVPDDIEAVSLYNDSRLSVVKNSVLTRDLFYAWTAQRIPELTAYDAVILSKNELAWYVPPDEQTVIHYIHTTPRTPYDLFQSKADSPITRLYAWVARNLYLPNTKFPDKFVANSELVARRIQRYWRVPQDRIEIVYPPVAVSEYSSRPSKKYYLTFSRLIPEKQIDRIIEAFDTRNTQLVVGGTGPERDRLEAKASGSINFVGYMSEKEKRRRLAEARGLIFNARNEDFGIIPIEAFASGTPVLGINDGYTKYQITNGKNGYLHDGSASGIAETIDTFERDGIEWSKDDLMEFATRFSIDRFNREMKKIAKNALDTAKIDVPHWAHTNSPSGKQKSEE